MTVSEPSTPKRPALATVTNRQVLQAVLRAPFIIAQLAPAPGCLVETATAFDSSEASVLIEPRVIQGASTHSANQGNADDNTDSGNEATPVLNSPSSTQAVASTESSPSANQDKADQHPQYTPDTTALKPEDEDFHSMVQCYEARCFIRAHTKDREKIQEIANKGSKEKYKALFDPVEFCKVIICQEWERTGSFNIKSERFLYWATQTPKYLQGYKPLSFFQESCRENNKPVGPSGYYYQGYRTLRNFEIKLGGIVPKKKKKQTNSAGENENVRQSSEKKGYNGYVDTTYEKEWTEGASHRIKQYQSLTTEQSYIQFPALTDKDASKLMGIDFAAKFPQARSLVQLLPELAKIIIKLCVGFQNRSALMGKIIADNDPIQSAAKSRSKSMKVKEGENEITWKPKISIFGLFNTLEKLTEKQATLHNSMKAKGILVEPYAAIVGPLSKPHMSYAVVNGQNYVLTSPVQAVDTAFKASMTITNRFFKLTSHIWKFLGSYIYKTPHSSKEKCISELAKLLDNLRDSTPN